MAGRVCLMPCSLLQVSADKLDSLTAFPKFFSQASYTKLASYRRAVFQALEVSVRVGYLQLLPVCHMMHLLPAVLCVI